LGRVFEPDVGFGWRPGPLALTCSAHIDSIPNFQAAPIKRPGFGAAGNKVVVLANHFEIRLTKQLVVTQYHVDVDHEFVKLTRYVKV
jgi:hypothetical protein